MAWVYGAVRALYSAMAWGLQPLVRRKLRRRARQEPGYGLAVGERFGDYRGQALGEQARGQWVWIHAVSLGETRAAAILLKALRLQLPGMRLLLTHGTATGRQEGQGLLQPGDLQVWQPWDTPEAVRRFVVQFSPSVGVLMETEVWPNLVAVCRAHGVPMALANARMNEKSLHKALRLSWLSRPSYQALSAVWPQSQADADRFLRLGAPVQAVLGNLKFDVEPDAGLLAQAAVWRARSNRPIVLLASSREGEEAMLVEVLRHMGDKARQVQWLVVPRHPQRFDAVALLLQNAGLQVSRRSQWLGAPPVGEAGEDFDVWLGDSVGEMPLYYALAGLALMGGSFAPLGGQNLIEALACECPVLLGPHTFNFSEAAQWACEAGAGQRVADLHQGVQQALALVQAPQRLLQMRQQALAFFDAHRGSAQATAQAIVQLRSAKDSARA